MRIGIDASNIRQGGGLTHLSQLLSAARISDYDINRIVVWAENRVLALLPDHPLLEKRGHPLLERGVAFRIAWRRFVMPGELNKSKCNLLFAPGGSVSSGCRVPAVVMSQNMLPFEPDEAATFGRLSLMRLKMRMLRSVQGRSFSRAAGVIFLSRYAQSRLCSSLRLDASRTALIPHGIEPRFFQSARSARTIFSCSPERPFRLLYVSILMPYKHQIEVARAIAQLRDDGLPVMIDFVGAAWGNYGAAVADECFRLDPKGEFLRLRGEIPFERLHGFYQEADGFIFASSCENLPNIMIEAMASGLPILSSNRGPMPEVLGNQGRYFDPYSVASIVTATRQFILDHDLRTAMAKDAFDRAQGYSWQRCADMTLKFLARIGGEEGR